MEVTEQEAEEMLDIDVNSYVRYCENLLRVKLNHNQLIGLIAFAFNIKPINFEKSKLLDRLNQGEDPNTVME